MKVRQYAVIMTLIGSGILITSCLMPGMIPLMPVRTVHGPIMEQNVDTLLETINGVEGQDWVDLHSLAKEPYKDEEFTHPGTRTYTVEITDDIPTYFSNLWCTSTQEILKQNFEHISLKLYFNDEELGSDVVHPIAYAAYHPSTGEDLVCLDFGVIMSEWPNGKYTLKTVSTFNEKINDGLADYEAGDYISIYNVTVKK